MQIGKSKEKKVSSELTLPRMTTVGLKGKQSVRASFKLSESCIQAINIVAKQLGIKHRSLFDYLVEDTESFETIARKISEGNHTPKNGIQKNFIISRESLLVIDNLCQKLNISRDTLIELSVRRLLPIIEKEIDRHRKRKDMIELVENHYKESRNILNEIKKRVGVDDPVYKVYLNTESACKQVKDQVNDIISKGKVVEGFDPNSLKKEF